MKSIELSQHRDDRREASDPWAWAWEAKIEGEWLPTPYNQLAPELKIASMILAHPGTAGYYVEGLLGRKYCRCADCGAVYTPAAFVKPSIHGSCADCHAKERI